MTLIVLSVDREKLPECTDEEFADWVKFEVGHLGGIKVENPLSNYDLEATVLEIG